MFKRKKGQVFLFGFLYFMPNFHFMYIYLPFSMELCLADEEELSRLVQYPPW